MKERVFAYVLALPGQPPRPVYLKAVVSRCGSFTRWITTYGERLTYNVDRIGD